MIDKALSKAIKIVGSQAELARRIGIKREAVSQWKRCPVARVHAVCAATGGKISPRDLRPDIFLEAAE